MNEQDWSETHQHGLAKAFAVSVVELPQGRYVRIEVKSDPPVRVDMEPDGALWLARELLNARNEAEGNEVGLPIRTLLMFGGESA